MENTTKLGGIIILAITLIVGIALFSSLTDQITYKTTATYSATNDTITSAMTTGTADHTNITSVTTIYNISGADVTTGCNVTLSTGAFKCNSTAGATVYALYSFQPEDYISDSKSRTIMNIIPLLLFLAILAVCIWGVYKTGLMDEITGK